MLKQTFSLLLAVVSLFTLATVAQAVPAGPGGIGDASGTSNLRLWLKADTGVQADDGFGGYAPAANTDQVRRWLDNSGYGVDAFQNSASNRPTFQTAIVNNNPIIRFNATNTNYLNMNHFMDFSEPTIYVVGQKTSTGTDRVMAFSVGGHGGANNLQFRYHPSGLFWNNINDFDNSNGIQNLPAAPIATMHIGSIELTTSATSPMATLRDFANGVQLSSSATSTSANWNTTNFNLRNSPRIGADSSNPTLYSLTGDIAEVLVFDGPLTSVQRLMVDNALAAKWDITAFTSTTPDKYRGDNNAQGDYDADVFGIGNDGVSTLLTNTSAGLGITVDSLDPGQYALAGNKTPVNSLIVDGADFQWERDFFVDVTGAFDATLTFDFDEAGLTTNPLYSRLLYSETEGGPFIVLDSTAIFSGNQISFDLSASQFLDGYYTIGGAIPEPSSFALLGLGFAFIARRRRRKAA